MFDWQTEEQQDNPLWNGVESTVSAAPWVRRRWFLGGLLGLLVLILAGVWLRGQLSQATEQVETAVLASHTLSQEAMAANDLELFTVVLSGSQPDWAQVQQSRFRSGTLDDRQMWGLIPTGAPAVPTVELNAQLSEAIVTSERPYQTILPTGEQTAVRLTETAVYRRGAERWLLAQGGAEFWGLWEQVELSHLTLIFPERDQEIATNLAIDLNATIGRLCDQTPELQCESSFVLRLEKSPTSFTDQDMVTNLIDQSSADGLTLPTPTLVGLPTNQASYEALRRGYTRQVVTAVLAQRTGYQCCEQELFFRVLLDWALIGQQLPPWSPTNRPVSGQSIHQATLTERQNQVAQLWSLSYAAGHERSGAEWIKPLMEAVYFVDPVQPINLLELTIPQMIALQSRSFDEWLQQSHLNNSPTLLADDFPTEQVHFVCNQRLFLYDFASRDFQELMTFSEASGRTPLYATDRGTMVQGQRPLNGVPQWQVMLWNGTASQVVLERPLDSGSARQYEAVPSTNGRLLTLSVGDPANDAPFIGLANLDECDTPSGCQLQPVIGFPLFSPDNQAYLSGFTRSNGIDPSQISTTLFWSSLSPDRTVRIGQGRLPFWIDNQRFGFAYGGGDSVALPGLAWLDGPGEDARPLIDTAEMSELLLDQTRPTQVKIWGAWPHPTAVDQLFITVALADTAAWGVPNGGSHLLRYELSTRELDVVDGVEDGFFFPPEAGSFSPNGRFLALIQVQTSQDSAILTVYNLETGEKRPYALPNFANFGTVFDWSADGDWLLVSTEGGFELIALNDGEQTRIPHGQSFCLGAAFTTVEPIWSLFLPQRNVYGR